MTFVMSVPAFAAYKQNITLPENQVWKTAGTSSRTGDYSTVYARCHSVYPSSGPDFFGKIQCRVTNSGGTQICDSAYVLDEGNDGYTEITIKEGYLATSPVTFQFRGNSSAAASAVVSYYGLWNGEFTESEWNRIKDMLPPEQPKERKRGRPAKYDNRTALNGMLWKPDVGRRGENFRRGAVRGRQYMPAFGSGEMQGFLTQFSRLSL